MKYQNIAVSAFIVHDDKALIVQRSAKDNFRPNNWEQVGGKIEWGEKPFDGLIREVKEETGLEIKPVQPYWLCDIIRNDEQHEVEIAVICELIGEPTISLSPEHQAYQWVTEEGGKAVNPMPDSERQALLAGFEFVRRWKE
ncbi:MAG: NUDIX domain-containing protein [Candidatus Andersenbacteria bacterium]|nr:NUDIX domain-containing protein [Candidatus Andersenbacteria bacterium]